jgi:hypothetical protein
MNWVEGLKYPNDPREGDEAVETPALVKSVDQLGGFSELVPYALSSPDQQDAGSCLYMSLTGIAEWWLARLHPQISRAPDGPIDLSERYLMNLAGFEEADNGVKNWKTDSVYLFNKSPGGVLNSEYRFTKAWVKSANSGFERAPANAPGAEYTTSVNWIDESSNVAKDYVALPRFEREVLYADPASNQWNVGLLDQHMIDRVKQKLQERKAPVHVIYNHFGYWHAVFIVGFDDAADNGHCAFVERFRSYMKEQPLKLREQARETNDASERSSLEARALKFDETSRKLETAYARQGGCHPKGVFYVRDSIYSDPSEPLYDYDPSQKGEETPYSKRIILREYDWLRYMANHVTQIYVL